MVRRRGSQLVTKGHICSAVKKAANVNKRAAACHDGANYFSTAIKLMQEAQEYSPSAAWYGVRTRSNFERVAAQVLQSKTYATYAPVYRTRRRRSDRVVELERPLFPGYVFCRLDPNERILPVLTSPGVVSLVGFGKQPAPIPDIEIEAVKRLLASGSGVEPYPFARIGQRVRVTQGSLSGLEGILVKKRNEWRMVISVTLLQRSISIEIDRECIRGI